MGTVLIVNKSLLLTFPVSLKISDYTPIQAGTQKNSTGLSVCYPNWLESGEKEMESPSKKWALYWFWTNSYCWLLQFPKKKCILTPYRLAFRSTQHISSCVPTNYWNMLKGNGNSMAFRDEQIPFADFYRVFSKNWISGKSLLKSSNTN